MAGCGKNRHFRRSMVQNGFTAFNLFFPGAPHAPWPMAVASPTPSLPCLRRRRILGAGAGAGGQPIHAAAHRGCGLGFDHHPVACALREHRRLRPGGPVWRRGLSEAQHEPPSGRHAHLFAHPSGVRGRNHGLRIPGEGPPWDRGQPLFQRSHLSQAPSCRWATGRIVRLGQGRHGPLLVQPVHPSERLHRQAGRVHQWGQPPGGLGRPPDGRFQCDDLAGRIRPPRHLLRLPDHQRQGRRGQRGRPAVGGGLHPGTLAHPAGGGLRCGPGGGEPHLGQFLLVWGRFAA